MQNIPELIKKIKNISNEMISGEIDRIANNYVEYSSWFKS